MKELTLLLVDDEVIIRKSFARIINRHYPNVQVIFAENGIEALERVESQHPDMMILDLGMMHMGGFEVLQQLAQKQHSVPTMVMSAYDMDDSMELMYSVSQQPDLEFLKKPVEKDVFLAAFERLMQRAGAEM
jgi:two-component system response regulator MprA